MSQKTGILAHHQSRECRATTHVPTAVADELVQRLVCERISRKLIRMLPPQSVFLAARPIRPVASYLADKLPAGEIPGVRFQLRGSQRTSVARSHYLPRFREVFGEDQMRRDHQLGAAS